MRSYITRIISIALLTIALLFNPGSLKAQITTSGSSFRPFSYEELARPLRQIQMAHNQAMNAINQLGDAIVDILENYDVDKQLQDELIADLESLAQLVKQLSGNGYSASINTSYNTIYNRVQRELSNYEKRLSARREENSKKASVEPELWSGTGFALNSGYIVTNYHVVDGAKTIEVHGVNGNSLSNYYADIIAIDKNNDIAIIKINDSRFNGFGTIPYAIKNQMVDVGEDIWVLGYPLTQVLGNEIKLTNGLVSSRSGYQGDVATYQISAPVQPGNSGGPLFDSKGNIVGIVNAGVPGAENVGYAIKTSYLKNLVDSYSLSAILPSTNSISSLSLTEQVKRVNGFVFLLICSSKPIITSNTLAVSSTSPSLPTPAPTPNPTPNPTPTPTPTPAPSNSRPSSSPTLRTITDNNVTLYTNEQAQLQVIAATVTQWESDNISVVKVTENGVITGVSVGKANVWAHYGKGDLKLFTITVRSASSSSNKPIMEISGTIRSMQGEVVRASVTVQGSNEQVFADSYGRYRIQAAKGDTIIFKHDDYETYTITVDNNQFINVKMQKR